MAKNRSQNRDRAAEPSRTAPGTSGQAGPAVDSPASATTSSLNQETSRKRRKKFGHN